MKLSDEWKTPQWLFDELNKEFCFDLDLCATEWNKKCKVYSPNIFNLGDFYFGDKDVNGFMNPPYSNPGPFIKRALDLRRYMTIACLVKADTSTKWWGLFWNYLNNKPIPGVEVRFLPKRVKFDPPEGYTGKVSAPPFPSAIIIMRKKYE